MELRLRQRMIEISRCLWSKDGDGLSRDRCENVIKSWAPVLEVYYARIFREYWPVCSTPCPDYCTIGSWKWPGWNPRWRGEDGRSSRFLTAQPSSASPSGTWCGRSNLKMEYEGVEREMTGSEKKQEWVFDTVCCCNSRQWTAQKHKEQQHKKLQEGCLTWRVFDIHGFEKRPGGRMTFDWV